MAQTASSRRSSDAEAALGEALFDLAGLSRLLNTDPEIALGGAINRFIDRFEAAEGEITGSGTNIEQLDSQTLRHYWELVKL